MPDIKIIHNPPEEELRKMGVRDWSIWTKEVSEFPWHYDEREICYVLEGEVVVTPDAGEPVAIGLGDLVTFPKDMSCTWQVKRAIRKHYNFG